MQQQLGTDCKRKHIDWAIIFFRMKRCVVTDNVFEMSFLSFGYACPSDYQAADKQSKDVRCWMLNCLAWSIDFGYSKWISVCGRYGHSCCYVHSRFVNSFVMIYLIRSKRRGENKKKFMRKVQVLYIKVTVYLMLSMLPDLVIVLGLCVIWEKYQLW